MHRDTMNGASGEWEGVLGFSQGAKLAASLLYRQPMPFAYQLLLWYSPRGQRTSCVAPSRLGFELSV
jgi:hypothetical protein